MKNPGIEWAKEIADSLNLRLPVAYKHAYTSQLGGPERASVLLTVSFDSKETWPYSILENSRYAHFYINSNIVELTTKSYKLPKLRKSRFKDTQGLFDILQRWIAIVNQGIQPMQSNPITVVGLANPQENHPRSVSANIEGIIYNRCIEIRAEKTGYKAGFYKHPFSKGSKVCIYALDNGDLLVHSKAGVKLWQPD